MNKPGSRGNRDAAIHELRLNLRHFVVELLVSNFEVTEEVGVNSTDLAALCLLLLHGPTPAGRLAELTGLTTGAVTGVVDRLEGAGFVRRELDAADRRRVIVTPDAGRVERELFPHFPSIQPAARSEFYDRYSVAELAVISNFISRLSAQAAAVTSEGG
jgi:DNA-binding MarR family transcriptional regulator